MGCCGNSGDSKHQSNIRTQFEKREDESKRKKEKEESKKANPLGGALTKQLTSNMKQTVDFQIKSGMFALKTNEVIQDKYKLHQKLGEGTYGVVVRAEQRETGKTRAIKTMSKAKSSRQEHQISQFNSEIEILQELEHPGIVQMYEAYQDEKNYYIVTEFCTGGELFDFVVSSRCLTESVAASVMTQLMSAINYCHRKKIVHRDIKPENILLAEPCPAQTNPQLRIIDFGTSLIKTEEGKTLRKKCGTCYYIAPEVLNRQYDEKCDIWSCGVIMYILLCGYPPFNAQNDNEIYALIRRGKFYFDPLEWDVVSDSAKDLVTKMLTMDPSQRPSAQEVIEHPWIQASIKKEKVDMPILSRALNRLHNFNATTKLQIAVSSFITSQLAEKEEVEQLKKTFTLLDVNKDGLLSKKELMEGFNRAMNLMMTEDELEEIMRSVDADGSGYVEYDEFIRSTVKKSTMLNQRNLEIAFNTFDTDRSGSISASEVKMILGQGNDVDNSFFETIIKEVDLDGNNEIDIREFKEMMFKMYNMDENRDEPVSATLEKLNTLSAN